MINIKLVGLFVRLFAVWLASWALRNLLAFWVFEMPGISAEAQIFTVLFSLLMLLLAAALWFFPLSVSSKLIPASTLSDHPMLSAVQIQSVGASLLGLWMLANTTPKLIYMAIALSARTTPLNAASYATIVQLLVEMAISFWLLLGARGILNFIHLDRK